MVFVAITGRPGIGKSTIFHRVVSHLRTKGYRICGFYCPEVRESGKRIGFKIIDIDSGEEGWLAVAIDRVRDIVGSIRPRIRIGRYVVVEDDVRRVGLKALSKCVDRDLVAIDEIGPMELSVKDLRNNVVKVLERAPHFLIVVHRNLRDEDIVRILRSRGTKTFFVTEFNRNNLADQIIEMFCST